MKLLTDWLYTVLRLYLTELITDEGILWLYPIQTVSHCELITDEGILWLYPIQTVSHCELITDGGIHWQTLSCFQEGIHWLILSCFQTLSGYGLKAWRYSLTGFILFSDLTWLWAYYSKWLTDFILFSDLSHCELIARRYSQTDFFLFSHLISLWADNRSGYLLTVFILFSDLISLSHCELIAWRYSLTDFILFSDLISLRADNRWRYSSHWGQPVIIGVTDGAGAGQLPPGDGCRSGTSRQLHLPAAHWTLWLSAHYPRWHSQTEGRSAEASRNFL